MCTSWSTYDSWLSIGKHEQITRVLPVCWHPCWSSGSNAYLNCASPWLCLSHAQLSHQGESFAASAVGLNGLFSCQGSISLHCIPQWTGLDRVEIIIFGGLVSWHSAEAVTQPIWLFGWGFSELLVKLEISLTLTGEIDNSNVKQVEEVSAYLSGSVNGVSNCTHLAADSVGCPGITGWLALLIGTSAVLISD